VRKWLSARSFIVSDFVIDCMFDLCLVVRIWFFLDAARLFSSMDVFGIDTAIAVIQLRLRHALNFGRRSLWLMWRAMVALREN
jgi:hypothetical protein